MAYGLQVFDEMSLKPPSRGPSLYEVGGGGLEYIQPQRIEWMKENWTNEWRSNTGKRILEDLSYGPHEAFVRAYRNGYLTREEAEAALGRQNMYSSSYQPYATSYYPASGFVSGYYPLSASAPMLWGTSPYSRTDKEEKEYQKKLTAQEKAIEREQRLEKQRQSLSNMPDWRKKIVRKAIKALLFEQEVNEIMSGLKWFLIFLGLAILFNFGKILDVIKLFVLQP